MNIIDQIKNNKSAVIRGEQTPNGKACIHCNTVNQTYKRHSFRKRLFLVIVQLVEAIAQATVHRVYGELGIWKCPTCGRAFTDYPEPTLPHKRYTQGDIETRTQKKYITDPDATYEKASQDNGMAVLYEGKDGEDGRRLAPSTIWRWIRFLGDQREPLRYAIQMIQEKDPTLDLHRQALLLPRRKYRSDRRHQSLQSTWRLYVVETIFKRFWGRSFFHEFAMSVY